MPTIKIKDSNLLFESQLPTTIDTFIQGWYTSVLKIQKMCEDPAFKEYFLSIYKKEHSQDFNFREVTNNVTTLCNNLDSLSKNLSKYQGKRILFRNPLPRMPKNENIKIGDNKQEELNQIKEMLEKTKDKMGNQIKDIQLNWQDNMQDKFSNNMDYFFNCIDSLNKCCEKTQKQIQTTSR